MPPKRLGINEKIEKEFLEAVQARGLSCACKEVQLKYGIDEKSIRSFYYRKGYHRRNPVAPRCEGADSRPPVLKLSRTFRRVVESCLSRWDCRSLEGLLKEAAALTGETACRIAVALCGMRKNGRPFYETLASWDRVHVIHLLLQEGFALKEIAGLLMVPARSITGAAAVAKRFGDPSARRWDLPYSHYRVVAGLPPAEAEKWLERAAANKWSSRRLAKAIAGFGTGNAGKTVSPAVRNTVVPSGDGAGSAPPVVLDRHASTGVPAQAGPSSAAGPTVTARTPAAFSRESMSRLELVIRREYIRKGGRKLSGAELDAIAAETGMPYWRVCGKYGSMVSQGKLPVGSGSTGSDASGSCSCLWEKGDALLRYLEAGFGFGEAVALMGLSLSQGYQLAEVCRKFPPEKRVYSLPVSFHAAAALGEDPHALLRKAAEEGWGLEDIERAAAGMMTYRELAVRYMAAYRKAVERMEYQANSRKAVGSGQDAAAAPGSAAESTKIDANALTAIVGKMVEEKLAELLGKE